MDRRKDWDLSTQETAFAFYLHYFTENIITSMSAFQPASAALAHGAARLYCLTISNISSSWQSTRGRNAFPTA